MMKITETVKRWNQLAGTDKKPLQENKQPSRLVDHDLFGNQFLKEKLNKDSNFHSSLHENVDEDLADALADKAEESGGDKEADPDAELGDDEKPTLSNSDLMKGLKDSAKAIAETIPPALNDEFADVMNSVKDMASDKQKLVKLIKYIEKIG